MRNIRIVPYDKAQHLIKEGDILLFRGRGLISRIIEWIGRGRYSHAALASIFPPIIECVEFREFKGGRSVNLMHEVEQYPNLIDVYRPVSKMRYAVVSNDGSDITIEEQWKVFDGKKATNALRELTGLSYNWKLIWRLARYWIPIERLLVQPSYDDSADNRFNPVCSTAVARVIHSTFTDLVPNLADFEVTPDDLSRSALLNYLFTLGV